MNTAAPAQEMLVCNSHLLGSIEVAPDTIITFEAGLPGFASLHRFTLVETQRDDLVWLQSVDDESLTLLLADPFSVVPGCTIDLPAPDLATLGTPTDGDALLVLVVAQLIDGIPSRINMQSPIVVNRERMMGRQVVLSDSRYGMHHPVTIA
jgi:flagellar assembly factor FliW